MQALLREVAFDQVREYFVIANISNRSKLLYDSCLNLITVIDNPDEKNTKLSMLHFPLSKIWNRLLFMAVPLIYKYLFRRCIPLHKDKQY